MGFVGVVKGLFGLVALVIFMVALPEVPSSDAVLIGIAIIIGGAVAYSEK